MAVERCIKDIVAASLILLMWVVFTMPHVAHAATAQRISLGHLHTLVLRDDGTIRAVGANSVGQLGDGTTESRTFPVRVKNLTDVISVAAGSAFSLALKSDGTVWAWGDNGSGVVSSDIAVEQSSIPVQIPSLSGVIAISSGSHHAVALKSDGTVWAWGLNTISQTGQPISDPVRVPMQVAINNVTEIVSDFSHNYALKADGSGWMWGNHVGNSYNPLGYNVNPVPIEWSERQVTKPTTMDIEAFGLTGVIYSGILHNVIILSDGRIVQIDKDDQGGGFDQISWSGALKVNLSPSDASATGIRWRVVGDTDWYVSGELIQGLDAGTYDIEFLSSYKWAAPAPISVLVEEGKVNVGSASFARKRGNLQVTIAPQAVVDGGMQWRVNGGTWQNSGDVVSALEVGNHVVDFTSTSSWVTPEPMAISVREGGVVAEATYQPKYADLTVNLGPVPAVAAGAQWRVVDGVWNDSGVTVGDYQVGQHVIEYSAVAGYEAPASETIELLEDGTVLTADYRRLAGSAEVTITPAAAVDEGARWRIGGGSWQSPGTVLSGISQGNHTIEFMWLSRWHTPVSQNVWIGDRAVTVASGNYSMRVGELSVTINPADVIGEGAKWRVQGGSWNASGDVISSLPLGNYMIEFANVAGWTTPPVRQVTVSERLNQFSADYVEIPGSYITVNIKPENVVNMGAQWRIFGKGWLPSGEQSEALLSGVYTIEFAPMTNWDAPASQTVILSRNDEKTITVDYSVSKSSHTLPIDSAALEAAEMDGATLIEADGSDTANELLAGDTQVYAFTAVEGRNYLMLLEGDNEGYISIFSEDGATLLARSNLAIGSGYGRVEWTATRSGKFFAKVGYYDDIASGSHQLSILVDGVKGDFNNDGYSDMLSRSPVTGDIHISYLQDNSVVGGGYPINQPGLESDNKLEAVADFNGDGSSDILWRDSANVFSVWLMDGLDRLDGSGATSRAMTDATNMQIVAASDFNGDGRDDILWQDLRNGHLSVWFMAGNEVSVSSGKLSTQPRGGSSLWEFAGVGDFNGDYKQDILWRNKLNGYSLIWFMDGLEVLSSNSSEFFNSGLTSNHEPNHSDWNVHSIADFSGDGIDDILWHNSAESMVRIWRMNGRTVDTISSNMALGSDWSIQSVADFNGDGYADLLLRDDVDNSQYINMYINNENLLPMSEVVTGVDRALDDWSVISK